MNQREQLIKVRDWLDEVALAGIVDGDSSKFYDSLHEALVIVEKLIEQAQSTPSPDKLD